jgi:hypothetical protein
MADKELISFLRDANDIVKLITGKSIIGLAKRTAELFGEDTAKKLLIKSPELPPDSPYTVLGVRPDAATVVVKASYRALIKMYADNPERLESIKKAYMQN